MAALIQKVVNETTSGSTVSGIFPSAVTAGSTIVVTTTLQGASSSAVTDTLGNTYTVIPSGNCIWYCLNALGGSNTITVNYGSATGYQTLCAMEFTKASAGGGFDSASYNSGTSTTPTSASITPAVANELIVSYVSASGYSPMAGSGTLVDNSTGDGVEYQTQSTTSSFTATMSVSTSATWYYLTAGFKPGGNTYTKNLNETVSLADVISKATGKGLSSVLSLSESFTRLTAKSIRDTFSLADSITRATAKQTADAFTLAETFTKSIAHSLATDALALTDSLNKAVAHSVSDAFSLGENLTKAVSHSVLDSFALADSLTKALSRSLRESFSLSESFAASKTHFSNLADSVGLSDAFSNVRSRVANLIDSVALVETWSNTRARVANFADALSLNDQVSKAIARAYNETFSLVDSLTKAASRSIVDAFALAETFVHTKTVVRVLTDSITLADTLAKSCLLSLSDAVSLTDAFGRVCTLFRTFVDTVSLIETISHAAQRFLSFADSFSLFDLFSNLKTRIISSATGGYLVPAQPAPLDDMALAGVFQALIVGLTALPGSLVRPRWQAIPPQEPTFGTDWAAVGVTTVTPDDGTPQIIHSEAGDTLIRHDVLDVMVSFYGPNAQSYAGIVRDGMWIRQNLDALEAVGLGLIDAGIIRTVPDLVNQQWRRRYDLTFSFRRQVVRVYPVLDLLSAVFNITTNTDPELVDSVLVD